MKLTDLDASFVGEYSPGPPVTYRHWSPDEKDSDAGAQGVLFQCPKCAVSCVKGDGFVYGAHYVLCWFTDPHGAPPVPDTADPGRARIVNGVVKQSARWAHTGTTVATLSLVAGPGRSSSVSLDVPKDDGTPATGCKWHGYVTDGEAT